MKFSEILNQPITVGTVIFAVSFWLLYDGIKIVYKILKNAYLETKKEELKNE